MNPPSAFQTSGFNEEEIKRECLDTKQRLHSIIVSDDDRLSKNTAAFAALHGKIRDLTSQNHSLLQQNRMLTDRMT